MNKNTVFTIDDALDYSNLFCSYLQSQNRELLQHALLELRIKLSSSDILYRNQQLLLIDLYMNMIQTFLCRYQTTESVFPRNYFIVETIMNADNLQEILNYFHSQFELIMSSWGDHASNHAMYDIIYYINHNYQENIKLNTLASLFGYNSSYLGKLFKQRIGVSFHSYLDYVRISRSKVLLLQTNLKMYDISEQIGYKNVDYFHQKFKEHVSMTPLAFRKKSLPNN